ncbi:MAG: DeoR/GlpR family DNA-binding transcription regulator [Pseudomonadota bacterium]
MRQSERHRSILKMLSQTPHASVAELSDALGASVATIRRDLNALSDAGALRRTHGGAEPIERRDRLHGTPFSRNVGINVAQKRAIARMAASLCADNDAIILDAGSTTFMMCEYLRGRSLQVLTNSLPIVQELLPDPDIRLHVPGGEVYREQNIILSPFENNGVNRYNASKMFVGAAAITSRGLLQSDSILVQAEQRLMARADEVIVVADNSKFRSDAALVLCELDRLHTVVTDGGINHADRQMLIDAGVSLLIAE